MGHAKHTVTSLPTQQTPTSSPGLLTAAELAARLSVPESWVRERVRKRSRIRDVDPLPCVVLGKYKRFRWADVKAWVSRQVE
jgi:hypothetical protein